MWSISWNPAKILMCPDATCGIGRHGFVRYYGTFGRRSIKKPKHVVFFPLSGGGSMQVCSIWKPVSFDILQQLPREFRDFWDLVHLSIAFVGTCVTALLYYDMLPFHSGNMIRLQRFLGAPPQHKSNIPPCNIYQLVTLPLEASTSTLCLPGLSRNLVESGWIPTGLNRVNEYS